MTALEQELKQAKQLIRTMLKCNHNDPNYKPPYPSKDGLCWQCKELAQAFLKYPRKGTEHVG